MQWRCGEVLSSPECSHLHGRAPIQDWLSLDPLTGEAVAHQTPCAQNKVARPLARAGWTTCTCSAAHGRGASRRRSTWRSPRAATRPSRGTRASPGARCWPCARRSRASTTRWTPPVRILACAPLFWPQRPGHGSCCCTALHPSRSASLLCTILKASAWLSQLSNAMIVLPSVRLPVSLASALGCASAPCSHVRAGHAARQ